MSDKWGAPLSSQGGASGGGGGISDGDKGDVTVSGAGSSWSINDGAVTLATLADIASPSIIGRVTAGTGVPQALTSTQATSVMEFFSSGLKGVVPPSGGGTSNYLRADGVWAPTSGDKNTFIFQPGGSAYGNTYTSFALLYADLSVVTGLRRIVIDTSLGVAVISDECDLAGVEIVGIDPLGTSLTLGRANLGYGGSFRNMNVSWTNSNTTRGALFLYGSTFMDGGGDLEAGGASLYLLDGSKIMGSTYDSWITTYNGDVNIIAASGSSLVQNVIQTGASGYNLSYLDPSVALSAEQNGDGTPPSSVLSKSVSFLYECDGSEGTDFYVNMPYGISFAYPIASYTVTANLRYFTSSMYLICCGPGFYGDSFQVQTSSAVGLGDTIQFQVLMLTGSGNYYST